MRLISHVRRGNGQTNKYQFLWHQMFEAEVPNTADQTNGQREVFDPGDGTTAADDPEEETGPDLPNTTGLDLPNLVSRSAVIGMVIPSGIHSVESFHQDRAAAASAFGRLPLSEATSQADYRFASAKSAEGSPGNPAAGGETAKTQNQKADAPAEAAGGEGNPSMRAKTQKLIADDEATPDPEEDLEDVLSDFHPAELEEWDGSGVPDWVCHATLNSAPDVSADVVCEFLGQKAAAGWQPRKWTSIPAMVRDAFAQKPKPAHVEPWTGLDVTNVRKWLRAFMDGEEPPLKLVSWIIDLATEYSLRASDIHEALDAAWKRGAAPGQKNAPRSWNWFYEVLRAAFIPGYAARLPEAPAQPHPAHQATAEQLQRGMETLDGSLVNSYRCKCGAEIRQYTDRVEGVCTCGQAKPISRAGTAQMPAPGKRRAAGGRQ